MKIITICGSMRFQGRMIEIAVQRSLNGEVVLTPTLGAVNLTEDTLKIFAKIHKEKIKLSDAILVVDIDGYIGASTNDEINFAESLNKEIIYYSHLI